jgi:hypothetical protein
LPLGGKAEVAEAQELMALLHREIRRGFDEGLSEEATARQISPG